MPPVNSFTTIVQARFARIDGDAFINTFCFDTGGATTGEADADIVDRLDNFYFTTPDGAVNPVVWGMTSRMSGLEYYMREVTDPVGTPGREYVSPGFVGPSAGGLLPPDVAVCISYRAGSPYTRRRRGRIYIGPLQTRAVSSTDGQVLPAYRTTLNAAAEGLASTSPTAPVEWMIYSRAGGDMHRITEGYVDVHFDTQRRRDPGTETYQRHPADWTS